MTISTTLTNQTYAGPKTTADTVDLPFHNGAGYAQFAQDDDIEVYHIDNAAVETLLTVGVEYHLNKTQNGGSGLLLPTGAYVSDQVEIDTADLVAADEFLKIVRNTEKIQDQDIVDNVVEYAVDRLTMSMQEVVEDAGLIALAARVTVNESDIDSAETDILTNATDIDTNETDIADNATDITSNVAGINDNAADIATNVSDIDDVEADIGTKPAWSGNTLSQQIQANINAIAALGYDEAQVDQNTLDIADNTTEIESNDTDIAQNASDIDDSEAEIILLKARVNDLEAFYGLSMRSGSTDLGNNTTSDIDTLNYFGSGDTSVIIHYEVERYTDDESRKTSGIMYLLYLLDPVTDTFSWVVDRGMTFGYAEAGVVGEGDGVDFTMVVVAGSEAQLTFTTDDMPGANYFGRYKFHARAMSVGL